MSLKTLRVIIVAALALFGCVPALLAQQPQRTRSPHGNLALPCQNCHVSEAWRPIRAVPEFNHNTQTRYPLLGQHQKVACMTCHVSPVFSETGNTCATCHADIHRRQFGASCDGCHSVQGWRIQIDAVRRHVNRFPLVGAHSAVPCEACHPGAASGTFTGLSAACVSCHAADYAAARAIDHKAAGFGTSCEGCHTINQWKDTRLGASFDHTKTSFPLMGAHASTACTACHTQGRFAGISTTCVSCHLTDFNATTKPNHLAASFSQNCQSCHTPIRWQGAAFDHSKTRFALTGAHSSVQCVNCHVNNQFAGTTMACYGCHAQAFTTAVNPNHVAAGFPQDCLVCHTTTAWKPASFDHSKTKFPLLGAHTSASCASCHIGGKYAGTPTACVSCHLANFNATTNPNHVAAAFSQDCQSCHTPIKWQGATFDHSKTRFALTGAHSSVKCSSCHVNNQFAGTTTACYGCHASSFNAAVNPNHVAAGFPQDCLLCHATAGWKPASFDHSKTKFPLMGAHTSASCTSCHIGGKYAGTPTACVSCHLANFNATTSPNHVAAAFPQDCQLCHTPVQWLGATFDHKLTRFPLTGAHLSVKCLSCHVGNQYTGTPTACYSCHASVYKAVTNPNHVAAGFPTTCETCHTTTTWTGAQFTHKFPIYSGSHAGKWSTCNDCHTNASNYAVFSCINCHAHDRATMDSAHRGRTGYVYDSLACYGCHPTGTH